MTSYRRALVAMLVAGALAAACNKANQPAGGDAARGEETAMTKDQRPGLRKVLTAHPDTLAKRVSDDTRARARAYVDAHPDLPAEIRSAFSAGEVWLGMTAEEIRLVVGEPTATDAIAGKPGHQALVYGDEGWVFRVDDRGYLYEHVER